MSTPIEFYFDFSSPYGYLAAFQIEELAARHHADVTWRPYMMGAAMKRTGMTPLIQQPLRGDYAKRDLARSARRAGIAFSLPDPFPIAALAPSRVFYWLDGQNSEQAKEFARTAYAAYFAENRDISQPEIIASIAESLNLDHDAITAALQEPAVKERLKQETNNAIDRGIFGSPFFIVDDEPFWGCDRLADIERWLETGGW